MIAETATTRLNRHISKASKQLLGALFDWRLPSREPAPAPAPPAPAPLPAPAVPAAFVALSDSFVEANAPASGSASWGDPLDDFPEPEARRRGGVLVVAPRRPHAPRRAQKKRRPPPRWIEGSEELGPAEDRPAASGEGSGPAGARPSASGEGSGPGRRGASYGESSYEMSSCSDSDSFPYHIPDWEAIREMQADEEYWRRGDRTPPSSSESGSGDGAPVDDV